MTTEMSVLITERAAAYAALNQVAEHLFANPSLAAHVAICEFSAEDPTPTLHLDLWRNDDLFDIFMSGDLNHLDVVAEGHWDGGRSYSLQFIP